MDGDTSKMCGRFTRLYTWPELVALYRLTLGKSNLQPRYNISPTTTIDTIVLSHGKRELMPMRWGLIPAWWSKSLGELKLATFDAPAETVQEKSVFCSAFKRRRCLIPASGYYEWQTIGRQKQPWYFTRRDGKPITIAGLWDEWTDKVTNKTFRSCAMVITEPNKFVEEVHDRMPGILEPGEFWRWEQTDAKDAAALMRPAGETVLEKWPVSKHVNSSRASDDDTTLIAEIDSEHLDTIRLDHGH